MAQKPESRVTRALRVKIRGTDPNGQPFAQTAQTVNISRHGARLTGIGCLKGSGQEIELRRWWRKARYRVVWIGQSGRMGEGDVGLQSVEPEKNIWGIEFPANSEPARAAAPEKASPDPLSANAQARAASAPGIRTQGPSASRKIATRPPGADAPASASKEFALRLKCPHCTEERWLSMRVEGETIDRLLSASQGFECSMHGVHEVLPLEGHERVAAGAGSAAAVPAAPASFNHGYRRSRRIHLQVPVLVYGRKNGSGTFREETSTMVVNAGGGLVGLRSRVEPGQSLLLVNKQSQEEQECRVAFIGAAADGKVQIGLAFRNASPAFWKLDYHKTKV